MRDIHLPGEPGLWPPAPGWWILAALLLVLLVWVAWAALRRYRLHRSRQRILAMLSELEQEADNNTPERIAQISILLRRLALMRYPRQRVAALTGTDWLSFLDESGGQGNFSQGPGQVLATGPYQPTLPRDLDTRALGTLVRSWVIKNTEH
ncbi:MAG: DUF4381 domain-containing protein [Gammaproteobacteria bacterium]|nr:DUF4381 domain-containing protein [Gammaproteobacteria bacterium]